MKSFTRKTMPCYLCLNFLLGLKRNNYEMKRGKTQLRFIYRGLNTKPPSFTRSDKFARMGEIRRGTQASLFLHKKSLSTSQQRGTQDLVNNNKTRKQKQKERRNKVPKGNGIDRLNSIAEFHWIIAPISIIQPKQNTMFPMYNIRHYYYKC